MSRCGRQYIAVPPSHGFAFGAGNKASSLPMSSARPRPVRRAVCFIAYAHASLLPRCSRGNERAVLAHMHSKVRELNKWHPLSLLFASLISHLFAGGRKADRMLHLSPAVRLHEGECGGAEDQSVAPPSAESFDFVCLGRCWSMHSRSSLPTLSVPGRSNGESKPIVLAWWGKHDSKSFFLLLCTCGWWCTGRLPLPCGQRTGHRQREKKVQLRRRWARHRLMV